MPEVKPRKKKASKKKEAEPAETPRKQDHEGIYIGIDVKSPEKECDDPKCPFHGTLPVRGQRIEGSVASKKMMNTVVVKREYLNYVPKYERLEKRSGRYTAHNPPCIETKVGDRVTIMECRPLSKSVSFVVVERK